MKKIIFFTAILFCILLTFGQEIQEEARAILIEVDVRVFKGNQFIKDLNIHDFELFPDLSLNSNEIREAFSDASVTCHFMYITEAPLAESGQEQTEFFGRNWVDTRGDIFRGFSEMADATGGLTISSRNPEFSFQQAMEASENYYL
ncbi:MAG: hypothetical protein R6V00_05425, partial [Candidatus Aminicenantes bacterium]